ncbi:hypothetical protein C2I18_08935 [Paenibacillus sp. PK3_47]|nr:hypothetical protein C2I18_08935 [Paenibacillus sp. PK3_47]
MAKLHKHYSAGDGAAERKFGTVGAVASAFIVVFLPQTAVIFRESDNNSGRKSKCFTQLRLITVTINAKLISNLHTGNNPFLDF